MAEGNGRRTIRTDFLARVEGEGAMRVVIRDRQVADVELRIYEPPRFFEAFLRGRSYLEAPDITARICGICPVAYQMSACSAMEDACGVTVDGPIRDLRRLLYCGEWIESHALHVFLLHAPDFLGYDGAPAMARDHPKVVEDGLALKKAGNEVMRVVGGREIHPIHVRVGGFYRAPSRRELGALVEPLERAREIALETVRLTASLPMPELEFDYELMALTSPGEYPIDRGRIASSSGLEFGVDEFQRHVVEEHVERSNALHATLDGRVYLTGPIARFNLSFDELSPLAREAAAEVELAPPSTNPFHSIVIRSLETLYACDEALRLIADYEEPDRPFVDVPPRAGVGFGATEAPRGTLWHRYELDDDGTILDAKIVPPTSQNQKAIEGDLYRFVERHVDLPDDELGLRCEQAIRNHDPCISCATHFLQLEVDRA
ncbi:MAG TPA: Ni/Fe hydrogenase subunit alpha [Gaiellaceae bacterium]|nr:Ni/Fe hydrogenase subunit alpha [Gaiellaceae bacterium]